MASQPSTSTEIDSEKLPTGFLLLELAAKHLRQSQDLISENGLSMRLQFNHEQCGYLVEKLESAVQSARESMDSSSSERGLVSVEDRRLMGKWKFLVRLAMDVESFVQECCKECWIQSACMLINAFEHVASLSSDLELCIWSFQNSNRTVLETAVRRELTSISEAQGRRLDDHVNLMRKVETNLQNLESISTPEELQDAIYQLEAANTVIPDNRDKLPYLSLRDQLNLLKKVEAALSSNSISDWEERQLATSLLERYRAAVASPIPDKPPHSDFMRIYDRKILIRERIIGKGSFGQVYKAKWLEIFAAEKGQLDETDQEVQNDFVIEVSILARLSHPNIVRLLCYVMEGDKCTSVVQELMDKDLKKLIDDRLEGNEAGRFSVPFSIDEEVNLILEIAEGMDYLHRRKVLHRDLKSENILVKCKKLEGVGVEFVCAKVADFGISKTKERTITLSHPTWNKGTTKWMAPEVMHKVRNRRGELVTGEWHPEWEPFKSDVYSFGMVSYEILTGKEPFENDTPSVAREKVLQGERPPLPSCYGPACLRSMVQKCWRPEPLERPSCADICRELRFMKGSLLIGWEL